MIKNCEVFLFRSGVFLFVWVVGWFFLVNGVCNHLRVMFYVWATGKQGITSGSDWLAVALQIFLIGTK